MTNLTYTVTTKENDKIEFTTYSQAMAFVEENGGGIVAVYTPIDETKPVDAGTREKNIKAICAGIAEKKPLAHVIRERNLELATAKTE